MHKKPNIKRIRVVPFRAIKKARDEEKAKRETLIRLIMSKFANVPFILRA